MIANKSQREHGKLKLSNYFQDFKDGDRVAVNRELLVQPKFPSKLQGRSGRIVGKRGTYYIVNMKDLKKEKIYIIHPVHLRKLK